MSRSIGLVRKETTVDRVVPIEDVGKEIVRGAWSGACVDRGMQFAAYGRDGNSANGAHSPIVGMDVRISSAVRSFSTISVSLR